MYLNKYEIARQELKEARNKTKKLMKMAEREISYMADFYYHQKPKEERSMTESKTQAVKVFNIFLTDAINECINCDKYKPIEYFCNKTKSYKYKIEYN